MPLNGYRLFYRLFYIPNHIDLPGIHFQNSLSLSHSLSLSLHIFGIKSEFPQTSLFMQILRLPPQISQPTTLWLLLQICQIAVHSPWPSVVASYRWDYRDKKKSLTAPFLHFNQNNWFIQFSWWVNLRLAAEFSCKCIRGFELSCCIIYVSPNPVTKQAVRIRVHWWSK